MLSKFVKSPNICDLLDDEKVKSIGEECKRGFDEDKASRADWEKWNSEALKLALQVKEPKSFPWPNSANVKFPLMTIAAISWHAKAYPATISADSVVKCRVVGEDLDGEKTKRAIRVGKHMSYQLLEDSSWEEQTDKAILNLSIVGTNFKKSYFSASLGHNVSELVLAKDLVVNYWTKSLDTCPRMTHIIPRFRNEVHENVLRETWRDCLEEGWYTSPAAPATTEARRGEDSRQRVTPPQPDHTTSIVFLEQHLTSP
jgi:chaperonin GroES